MFSLRRYYRDLRRHFAISQLQSRFDNKVEEVQSLMAEGQIKASGDALVEAERLRKEIEALEGVEAPSEEEITEKLNTQHKQ
ncbi:hypothetical protein GP5015_624 [gamma proteobacterium HTCC5015]|nr:hypothetical protein GP5015_624 [gamma proteobacterium HTCC5015]